MAALAAFQVSLLGTGASIAASVAPLSLDQIVAGAKHIVHVRCTGNVVQADPDVGVVTITSFVVLDRAKGGNDPTFTVRQIGGELQGLAVDYHVPKFSVGEEYVLFMPASSRLGLASPVGLSQGAFSVLPGTTGKEVGNGRDFGDLLTGMDAARVPPRMAARLKQGGQARSRMDLDAFMTLSRDKVGTR
ncbi:MAG TPA: hypothetical protein VFJ68_08505 [Casimicrobiaceae bacterium]|nr:hypothetical protein [Casimicrobiaceae bacterium]